MIIGVSLFIVGDFHGYVFVFMLLFQAEDGIRDRVRSRGLGDVYKRQDELISNLEVERDRIFQRRAWEKWCSKCSLSLIHI